MSQPFDLSQFRAITKGRKFEDFEVGQRFVHHWGRTITAAEAAAFSAHVCNWNALYMNQAYAQALNYPDRVVNPMLVLCLVVGMSVEDLSEAGTAFLGIDDCSFESPVFPGDTVTSESQVVATRRSASRAGQGVVTWETRGMNQHGAVVVSLRRTNMVECRSEIEE
jgi:itaconyl-CoA hydratase